MDPPDRSWVVAQARQYGPIAAGSYRVIVFESDGRVSSQDHGSLPAALQHADDAASEGDAPPPLAYVLDASFRIIAAGDHYAS